MRRQFLCDMHSLMSLGFLEYLFIYWFLPGRFFRFYCGIFSDVASARCWKLYLMVVTPVEFCKLLQVYFDPYLSSLVCVCVGGGG